MSMTSSNDQRGYRRLGYCLLLASTAIATSAHAQSAPAPTGGDDIIVTASKREENLQDVPIAITALGTEKLERLQIADFDDYARYLPNLSYQTAGPGYSIVYFRGLSSGDNGNHSGSLPSVGTYLDEQPITTTTGALDLHLYDIARVEALAGPQGTLYGASSQAGTIRIITNKPDTSGFYGGADVEVNSVRKGGIGYVGEGFINAPLSENIALRVVGWYDKDAGYIDNVAGSLFFPTSGITMNNDAFVEKDYNDVETYGGRAALKIDLDEDWTITPQIMAQKQKSHGFFAVESGLDDLQVQQFNPEFNNDRWWQATLTLEGKIGNWDVTYAGGYLRRKIDGASDYSDYAYFYDQIAGYGAYFYDNNGDFVNPNQYIQSRDRFTKQSHELRFASPADGRVRFIGGLFYQRQTHNIEQNYIIDNIADSITVPGTESNIWLTKQLRVDRDYAIFGEITADVTDKLTATMGVRVYKFDNTLFGFFGFSDGYSSRTGISQCFRPSELAGSPCTNIDQRAKDTDFLHKLNLTYKFTDDALVYGTISRGFRPGGPNRRATRPPFEPDFVENYEVGFKTTWLDKRLRVNGAVYYIDWTNFQNSALGLNGLTEIANAADARIYGAEFDIYVNPVPGLTVTASGSYIDAKTTTDFCSFPNAARDCSLPGPGGEDNALQAPAGVRLPLTAKFKGNVVGRYEFAVGSTVQAHIQGSLTYEGKRRSDLRPFEESIYGALPSYDTVDLSTGLTDKRWSIELFVRNLFDTRGRVGNTIQCLEPVCGDIGNVTDSGGKIYTYLTQPRTIGLKLGTKF